LQSIKSKGKRGSKGIQKLFDTKLSTSGKAGPGKHKRQNIVTHHIPKEMSQRKRLNPKTMISEATGEKKAKYETGLARANDLHTPARLKQVLQVR